MPETTNFLLAEYAQTRDAEAFQKIVLAHKDMVYATARRMLRNTADAEDVTQNCFLMLARSPGKVRESLPGWLHRAAVGKSVDLIRREQARRAREGNAMRQSAPEDVEWEGIKHALDETINRLPDELRIPLIRCYLEGQKQEAIAKELGLTQSAVAKRIQKGVELLRPVLRKGGWMGSVALLATLLGTKTAEAAPAALTAALGKMAIAGLGGATSAATGTISGAGGILMSAKTWIVAAGVAAVIGAGAAVVVAVGNASSSSPQGTQVVQADDAPGIPATTTAPQSPQAEPVTPPPAEVTMPPGEAFLRNAIDAVFTSNDPQALTAYFDPDAERKNQGKGSALRLLQGTPRSVMQQVVIQEMVFFGRDDLDEIRTRFPDDMWNDDRVAARLTAEACAGLVIFDIPGQRMRGLGKWVVVARKFGDQYRIVYWDDN